LIFRFGERQHRLPVHYAQRSTQHVEDHHPQQDGKQKRERRVDAEGDDLRPGLAHLVRCDAALGGGLKAVAQRPRRKVLGIAEGDPSKEFRSALEAFAAATPRMGWL